MNPILNTAYPDPGSSTGLMLWQVTNSWQRAMREALAPFDLTHVQFVLLAVLTSLDDSQPVTQKDLAQEAGTDPMMTSQVLRTLESKGLIARHSHPSDQRAKTLTPTQAGIKLVNRAIVAVEQADRTYFSPLNDAINDFTQALHALAEAHTTQQ